jgi:hypothetical protein
MSKDDLAEKIEREMVKTPRQINQEYYKQGYHAGYRAAVKACKKPYEQLIKAISDCVPGHDGDIRCPWMSALNKRVKPFLKRGEE